MLLHVPQHTRVAIATLPDRYFLGWASVPGQVEKCNQCLVIIQPRFLSDFLQWLLKWQALQKFYLKNLSSSLSFPVCSTLVDMVDIVWDFLISQPIFYPGVPTYHDKDTRISLQKLLSFPYKKNKTKKWPIELWTLKQEMETGDDSVTMRESFTMHIVYFVKYDVTVSFMTLYPIQ